MKEIGNGLKKMFVEYIFYSTCALIKMIYCVGCNSRDQKSRMWKKVFFKALVIYEMLVASYHACSGLVLKYKWDNSGS